MLQTAYTSLWIIYLLSKDAKTMQETQNRDKDYIKHVIKEAMRLYPVAPFLTRILPKESILGHYKLEHGVS